MVDRHSEEWRPPPAQGEHAPRSLAEIYMGEHSWNSAWRLTTLPPFSPEMPDLPTQHRLALGREELNASLEANLRNNLELVARLRQMPQATEKKIVTLLLKRGTVPENVQGSVVTVEHIALLLFLRLHVVMKIAKDAGLGWYELD
ncbi:uncharacterized protein RCC_00109 [Ramularia collo-cygni]|uniref:Uncharacterized protein n=1 Tax=Ramularia collo-cygni TaxID=112498 RepID=A0A2D3UTM6_9PEZI|nr:uncharacterized protein RCC_00109 [Ramularia collo-cygni]CZT14136.1 uncharacterized protein RCC_00109 [Ramularia collo-cygni]